MAKEIAVYLSEDEKTASLNANGKIKVYRKEKGTWSVAREQEFTIDKHLGLKGLRKQIEDIIDYLGGCKIFVGLSIVGIPYYTLEKAGFSIWEFEGDPAVFLDYILQKEEENPQAASKVTNDVIPIPIHMGDGRYHISIKEIQESNSAVTSKQVLQSVIRKGNFYSLEILCNHVPMWLEGELLNGNLISTVQKKGDNELVVVVSKISCQECH